MADVEKVQVVLEAKIEAFKRAIQNIQRVTRKAFQDINKEMASARPPEYNQALSQVERMRTSMRLYAASAKVASGAFKYTDEFVSMSQDLQQSTADAASLRQQLELLNRYADAAESSGDLGMAEGYRANAEQVAEQLELVERRADSVRVAIARLAEEGRLTRFAGVAVILRRIGSALGSVAKNAGQLAGGAIRRAGGAFSSLIHRMSEGIGHMRLFGRSAGSAGTGLGNLTRSIFNAQLALRLLSSAARWVRSAVAEGLKNLQTAMPTSAAANSINQLTASLSQLKNAIGAAAAPILSAIAPALNTLINLAITAANAVGALFAALTGQKYVAAVSGVSDGLGAAASNAGAANENAQKLKRTLMGFDQINKLDDADSGSSGGGGGGGGGGAGGVTGGFVEAEIPESIQKFADMIKAAWEKADFTEIGNIVGEKMINAMNAIPWDKIQETANKGAKSLATFLNGVLTANIDGNTVGSSIGSTLANAVNTGFGAVKTFAENFSWTALGTTISDSINGFFKTWNPSLTAEAISGIATGILTTFTTAVQGVKWSEVGAKCAELLINIDWAGILSGAAELAGSAVGAIAAFIGGFLSKGVSGAKDYFEKEIEECGGNVIAGIYKGIEDALKNIDTWCYNNIFLPFYNGLKKVWDSSVFADIFGELPELKAKVDVTPTGELESTGSIAGWLNSSKMSGGKVNKEVDVTKGGILGTVGTISKWMLTGSIWGDSLQKPVTVKKGGSLETKGTIFDWIRAYAWGDPLKKPVTVEKGGGLQTAGNIFGWIRRYAWGGGVYKPVSVEKGGALASSGSIASWLTSGSRWGGGVWKPISLEKGSNWSGMSVEGWVDSKKAGRSVDVPVKLKSDGGVYVGGEILGYAMARGGIFSGGRWLPVTAAAGGGSFNTGQFFVAREAGPELVGTIGGNTAVMNNEQIVSSVAAGVAQAVASVMSAFAGQMNGGGDVTVYIDGDELTTAVVRGMRRQDKRNNPKVVFGG